jgi:RNA polymerase sigma-70 factor (ECF subfamily)
MMTAVADASEVYRRHAEELVRYATALVGPTDAPDVVIDAVMGAFGSPGWSAVENQRAFLYRAVLNRSMSVRRSDARRAVRELRAAAGGSSSPTDSSVDAQRALTGLSPQQRAVVYLTYWDDLTPAQVAALLGVSDGSVRKQLARAREHLRRILDEH